MPRELARLVRQQLRVAAAAAAAAVAAAAAAFLTCADFDGGPVEGRWGECRVEGRKVG